ncbi:MAG: hypothetical protein ACRDTA_05390 [Pseudonocardiaceae bacterium]
MVDTSALIAILRDENRGRDQDRGKVYLTVLQSVVDAQSRCREVGGTDA